MLAAGVLAFAQTPAAKSGAAKSAGTSAAKRPVARPNLMNPASLRAKAPDLYKVKFTTTKGDFVVEVHRDWAPYGADRFFNLVRAGYYDDCAFFRVLRGFVAQFGINAKPAVNKVWMNANIHDDPVKQSNKRGYLTFAAASTPNSRSTQLFVNLRDNQPLDASGFAPIGMVTDGMDVVDKLYSDYGEGAPDGKGPDQDKAQAGGKLYFTKNFPMLDSITTAKIMEPDATAPATPPAAK